MVTALLVVLFLGVVQVGYALHVRNTLLADATEGARAGARSGAGPRVAEQRAAELIRRELPGRYASNVSAHVEDVGGVAVVAVTVTAPLPVLGPLGPGDSVTVTARSVREDG